MKKRKAIRVVWDTRREDGINGIGTLLEMFRHAGLVKIIKEEHIDATVKIAGEDYVRTKSIYTFDILPKGVGHYNEVWSQQNMERMNSFGVGISATLVDEI